MPKPITSEWHRFEVNFQGAAADAGRVRSYIANAAESIAFSDEVGNCHLKVGQIGTDQLSALLKPGILVYLDGRNEHGTHVLELDLRSAGIKQSDLDEIAEGIMSDAEKLGFKVGDAVWTCWTWFEGQYGEGRCELAPGWEYHRIDTDLSRALAERFPKPQPMPENSPMDRRQS